MKLTDQKIQTITKETAPLSEKEAEKLLCDVPQWSLCDLSIAREFLFTDFPRAMDFVNHVANIANEQDHHPDITISYNKVLLTLSTHKIGGLSRNDFIVAAIIDRLVPEQLEKAA